MTTAPPSARAPLPDCFHVSLPDRSHAPAWERSPGRSRVPGSLTPSRTARPQGRFHGF